MNLKDIAFCAGLFEGEGWVGTIIDSRNGKSRKIRLGINMADIEPLLFFLETFEYNGSRGSMNKPGKRTGPNGEYRKPMYRVQYDRFEDVQFVVASIWSYLSPRRKEQYRKAIIEYSKFRRELTQPYRAAPPRKLTIEQVLDIKTSTKTQQSLAAKYGVCQATISQIKLGKRYAEVVPKAVN